MTEKECYDILEIKKSSSDEDIKKAYHILARKYHPDRNVGNTQAERKFKEIAEAYRLIAQMRENKDKNDWFKKITDIKRPSVIHQEPVIGTDIHKSISIDFTEAVMGCEKQIQFQRQKMCGCVENNEPSSCCSICNGKGYTDKCVNIIFTIPQGIKDGQTIRISGKGNEGSDNKSCGDLIIHVSVKENPNFVRRGLDLYYKAEITFPEAVLGTVIEIPTVTGIEKHKLRPGIQSGARFCMQGRGLTDSNGNIGNQYIIVRIIMPQITNDKQIALLKEVDRQIYGIEK